MGYEATRHQRALTAFGKEGQFLWSHPQATATKDDAPPRPVEEHQCRPTQPLTSIPTFLFGVSDSAQLFLHTFQKLPSHIEEKKIWKTPNSTRGLICHSWYRAVAPSNIHFLWQKGRGSSYQNGEGRLVITTFCSMLSYDPWKQCKCNDYYCFQVEFFQSISIFTA